MNYLVILFLFFCLNASAEEVEVEFSIDDNTAEQGSDNAFDFGEAGIETEDNGFPLQGKLSFDMGYQIGSPQRWVTFGPYGQFIYDQQTDMGQFYAQLTLRNNYAFDIEKDAQNVIDRYRIDPIWRDAYWKKAFGDFSLTVGKNIITWGKADLTTTLDILSPIDNRGILFAKPEEIKLGQNLIKLDWYHGKHQLSLVYVPDAIHNLQTEKGHPYFPQQLNNLIAVDKQKPSNNSEWALRWSQTQDKWETSLVMGKVHLRDPIYSNNGDGTFEQDYPLEQVIGFGTNYSADPFLWKAEILYSDKHPMQLLTPFGNNLVFNGSKQVRWYKGMIGFDYASSRFGNWLFEYSGDSPLSKDSTVVSGEGNTLTSVMWYDQFLHDDLSVNIIFMSMVNINDHLVRAILSYQLDDNWRVSTQLTTINSQGGNVFLDSVKNFDRFDISLDYNFDLANNN